MRIGVYAGMFDPLTNGHLWVINQGKELFDEFRVVLGPNPSKRAMFKNKERLAMLQESTDDVICDYFTSGSVVNYIDRVAEDIGGERSYFTIVRGIRNQNDLEYEANIWQNTRQWAKDIQFKFLSAPDSIAHISSSWIKELCKGGEWDIIKQSVPDAVFKKLQSRRQWIVNPPVASIFETTTAGFGPIGGETFETYFDMEDVPYCPDNGLERSRQFIHKMVDLGFINFSKTVTGEQVRKTLDPFPVDVVVSDTFTLKEIDVWSVEPLGYRFLTCSRSIGPIIVDDNQAIPESEYFYVYKDVGQTIVIEGKHRLLDARARGDEKIWAWVGDKVGDRLDE